MAITRARRAVTARELGEAFDRSPRTIRRVIAEERSTYEARAQKRRKQIVMLHEQGLGVRAIARELRCDPSLVSRRLKEAREAGQLDTTPKA